MFENSGTNVKGLAKATFALYTLFGAIAGLYYRSAVGSDSALYVIIGVLIGLLIGWLNGLTLYCLGDIWCLLSQKENDVNTKGVKVRSGNSIAENTSSQYYWTCSKCGKSNLCTLNACKFCGNNR